MMLITLFADESDDERYKTPDCSVEMGIRSAFMFMSCNPGTSVTSEVDEAAIVRNTQFFPKVRNCDHILYMAHVCATPNKYSEI